MFYIGFRKKTRGQLADNPDMVLHQQQQQNVNSPHNTPSCTHNQIAVTISLLDTPPQPPTLVLQSCPRKLSFLHWFYKVVREQGCDYIGFIRLSARIVVFTLVLQGLSADHGVLHWFSNEISRTPRGHPGHGFAPTAVAHGKFTSQHP